MRVFFRLAVLVLAVAVCLPDQAFANPQPGAFDIVVNEGKKLSSQKRYADAALVFNRVLSQGDDTQAAFQEAQYEMGVALFGLGLPVSAFTYFDHVGEKGSEHVRYYETLPWLLKIHQALPGETSSLLRMSAYPVESYPVDISDEINFYVGQYHYYAGNLDQALASFMRVGQSKPELYVKAMYFKGVVFVRKNDARAASRAFVDVLSYLDTHEVANESRYAVMANLATARVFYTVGHSDPEFIKAGKVNLPAFNKAVEYFDKVDQSSEYWLDSLFEKSWAYFMLGNYARALGNLITVNSPYFEEEYYPEGYVLRAVIFFMNCLYDEALETVDPFYKEYYEISKELKRVLTKYEDPASFYQYLASLSKSGGDQYSLKVKKIFNAALADRNLRRLFEYVVAINNEMDRVNAMASDPVAGQLVDFLVPSLEQYRSLTIAEAGQLARERLERISKELRELLSQALKVRFESLNAQKGIVSKDEQVEQLKDSAISARASGASLIVDSEHQLWPWNGEYWKDELGSYYYPIQSACEQ